MEPAGWIDADGRMRGTTSPGVPIPLSYMLHVLTWLLVVGWISRTRSALVCVFELYASLALGKPEQPDFAVWLQARDYAMPSRSINDRGPPIQARFVVITTILQSRMNARATAPSEARGLARDGMSVWWGQTAMTAGKMRRISTCVSLTRHARSSELNLQSKLV